MEEQLDKQVGRLAFKCVPTSVFRLVCLGELDHIIYRTIYFNINWIAILTLLQEHLTFCWTNSSLN